MIVSGRDLTGQLETTQPFLLMGGSGRTELLERCTGVGDANTSGVTSHASGTPCSSVL